MIGKGLYGVYIVSRENGVILNFRNAVEIFTGSNGTALAAKQTDGKLIILQEYESRKEAKEAVIMMSGAMERKTVVYVPDKDEIKGHMVNSGNDQHHLSGGRKQKGHGGS